jgi:hypothetical protein
MNRRNFLLGSMGAVALALAPKALVPAEAPFPEGWKIVEETMDEPLYGVDLGQRYAKALARSMMQTKEMVARNVLDKAHANVYTHKTYGLARYLDG